MRYDTSWLTASLAAGHHHTYIGFWGDDNDSPVEQTFSNVHQTSFTVDQHHFT